MEAEDREAAVAHVEAAEDREATAALVDAGAEAVSEAEAARATEASEPATEVAPPAISMESVVDNDGASQASRHSCGCCFSCSEELKSFIFVWVAATVVGVLWTNLPAYVYDDTCVGSDCWPFVALLAAYVGVAQLAYPALTWFVLHALSVNGARTSVLDVRGNATAKRLQATCRLCCAALSTCQSIAYSTFIYYLLAEVHSSILDVSARGNRGFQPRPPLHAFDSSSSANASSSTSAGASDSRSGQPFYYSGLARPPPQPHPPRPDGLQVRLVAMVVADLAIATVLILTAALLTRATAHCTAKTPPSLLRAPRPPYWLVLLRSFESCFSSAEGYALNAIFNSLVFQPLVAYGHLESASGTFALLSFVHAGVLLLAAYCLCVHLLRTSHACNAEQQQHHAPSLSAYIHEELHKGSIACAATGLASSAYDFCTVYIASLFSSGSVGDAIGLVLAILCFVLVLLAAAAFGEHTSWLPTGRGAAFLLAYLKWLTNLACWYPLNGSLDYVPGYDNASVEGVLITLALALVTTALVAHLATRLTPPDEHADGRPTERPTAPLAESDASRASAASAKGL